MITNGTGPPRSLPPSIWPRATSFVSVCRSTGIKSFLAFMRKVVRTVPKPLAIHVILDNYQTHKHPAVKAWLARNPRVHFHFTPTSASWLNLVERFFKRTDGTPTAAFGRHQRRRLDRRHHAIH